MQQKGNIYVMMTMQRLDSYAVTHFRLFKKQENPGDDNRTIQQTQKHETTTGKRQLKHKDIYKGIKTLTRNIWARLINKKNYK